ncbi:class I adenylate-forming enzyme family protein [Natrialbaceae archaeon A-gly3]
MRNAVDFPRQDLLAHRERTTPEDVGLIDVETGEEWTYREYSRRVDRFAPSLSELGDRVGVLLDTRPAAATVFFAAMRTGTTLVPLSVRETVPELAAKVDRTGLEAVICERETERMALEVTDAVYSVDEPGDGRVESLVRANDSDLAEPAALEADDTLLVMFTSGTSGEPKAVPLTVENLVASATASAFRLGVDPDDRWLCCLPTYHMGGLAPIVRSALYGATVVIQREFDPRETARVLTGYEVTGVSLVPTMCTRLLETGWSPDDALRFVLLGGAPASEELLEACQEAGVPVCPTYGMTETASQIATATPEEAVSNPGTVGPPLVGTEMTIVGGNGRPLEAGETGEIVVSGPTVTPGYLDEEATEAAFGEFGLHTGDVGHRDEAGRLWVTGRRSDRIVTGGENVDPGEVADVLRGHPGLKAAAVVGLSDPEWGERVGALVVPERDRPTVEDVLEHCDGRLAGFKRPKTVGFAEELPRTASGTVDREAVRELLELEGTDVTGV